MPLFKKKKNRNLRITREYPLLKGVTNLKDESKAGLVHLNSIIFFFSANANMNCMSKYKINFVNEIHIPLALTTY